MSEYRTGDALAITQPDGSRHTFRVVAVAADPVDPDALSFTLRRVHGSRDVRPSSALGEALAAASGTVIGVVPLAQKLAEYWVHPAADVSPQAVTIGHDPCAWRETTDQYPDVARLPSLVALALEHHLAGCRVPR